MTSAPMDPSHDTSRGNGEARYWPNRPPAPDERPVSAHCAHCDQEWCVHDALAGSRLRCDCGQWVDVPMASGSALHLVPQIFGEESHSGRHGRMLVSTDRRQGVVHTRDVTGEDVPVNAPVEADALVHANLRTRRRWLDRGLFELVGILCAFFVPAIFIQLSFAGRERALFMPFSDLAAGFLILIIGVGSSHYAFGGLRGTRARYYFEAILVAGVMVALALGWMHLLGREGRASDSLETIVLELGLPLTIACIGVFPAVFEELAFRGIVQGRLMVLMGTTPGILVAGTAFALAHGVTVGLPFHIALGVYLGWLRYRSKSLYPGMITHFIYNTVLVVAAYQALGGASPV